MQTARTALITNTRVLGQLVLPVLTTLVVLVLTLPADDTLEHG